MSINEIVNYVNRTPHNTNPNVIASMVQGTNEQAVYESVEKLKQDGGVGYTEKGKVIFSSNDMILQDGVTIAFEENTPIRLEVGKTYTVTLDSGTYTDVCEGGGETMFIGNPFYAGGEGNGKPYAVLCVYDGGEDAMWVFGVVDSNCGSRVTVTEAETVHTIDPKYLSEPVKINLADYGIDLASMVLGGGGHFEVYDATEMWDAIFQNSDKNLQFVARMGVDDFYLLPCVMTQNTVCFSLLSAMRPNDEYVMVHADIVMGTIRGNDEITGAGFFITVTQTPVPT